MDSTAFHNTINRHIGRKIKEIRINLGISQKELGKLLGVTYQQAHKYETGANRISASSLMILAEKLNVSPAFFFEDFAGGKPAANAATNGHIEAGRINLEVAKNFKNIRSQRHQEAVNFLIRSLSE